MKENQPQGGAATSLGAHSKDDAASRPTSGASAGGSSSGGSSPGGSSPGGGSQSMGSPSSGPHNPGQHSGGQYANGQSDTHSSGGHSSGGHASGGQSSGGSWQQTGAELAGQAREGMDRMASGVREAAASARDTIATRGSQAMETTGQMVRDQPFMALAVTGIACFAIGMMIGRGRY